MRRGASGLAAALAARWLRRLHWRRLQLGYTGIPLYIADIAPL